MIILPRQGRAVHDAAGIFMPASVLSRQTRKPLPPMLDPVAMFPGPENLHDEDPLSGPRAIVSLLVIMLVAVLATLVVTAFRTFF